jgi:hypothetical protein
MCKVLGSNERKAGGKGEREKGKEGGRDKEGVGGELRLSETTCAHHHTLLVFEMFP